MKGKTKNITLTNYEYFSNIAIFKAKSKNPFYNKFHSINFYSPFIVDIYFKLIIMNYN